MIRSFFIVFHLFVALLIIGSSAAGQGRLYRPDVSQIFDSELVVRGKIVQNKSQKVLVRIDEVIKDGKYGMKPGDHVWLSKGSSDNIVEFEPAYAKGIFYLNKYPNYWAFNDQWAGSTLSGPDSTLISSPYAMVSVPNEDLKRQIQETLACYECRLDTFYCDPKLDSAALIKKTQSNEFLRLLYETQERYKDRR